MMTPLFIGSTSMQEVLLVHSWYCCFSVAKRFPN